MNFEKVSEGLAGTIEKLSQKNKKTVTEERAKAQTLFERAMDPKGGAVTPTVPAVTKETKPAKTKTEAPKLDLTKMPTVGQPMTPEQSKYVKETPGARSYYMKQVSPQWKPAKKPQ
jgi:hypothetical protein